MRRLLSQFIFLNTYKKGKGNIETRKCVNNQFKRLCILAGVMFGASIKLCAEHLTAKEPKPRPTNKAGKARTSSFNVPWSHSEELCIEAKIDKRLSRSLSFSSPPYQLTGIKRGYCTFIHENNPTGAGGCQNSYLQLHPGWVIQG